MIRQFIDLVQSPSNYQEHFTLEKTLALAKSESKRKRAAEDEIAGIASPIQEK